MLPLIQCSIFRILIPIIALCAAQHACADLFAGRVYTQPEKIYVNQPFDLVVEIEVTRGKNIENIRIQGLPGNSEFITLGQLTQERLRENRRHEDGTVVDVLRFHADARCHTSVERQFNPILSCDVIERRSRGFFSFSSSSTKKIRLAPFTLKVHQLPEKERPDNFSGAIGEFTLTGALSKHAVRPGDIITISLELKGKGWLNSAPAPTPDHSEDFKSYPPKEILREENRIKTEQVLIPISTNAVVLAPARFNYFNPATERYETCASNPFKLQFITAAPAEQTNSVNVIATRESPSISADTITITAREVNTIFHKILPVALACLTLLAASFSFLTVVKLNRWMAIAVTLLTTLAGGFLTFKASRYEPSREITLKEQTEVYLAPNARAPLIMKLQNSTKVIPLESTERWTRIEAEEQRGWVLNSALEE